MNNLPSYFGLVDAKIRASDKDLPVGIGGVLVTKTSFDLFGLILPSDPIWEKCAIGLK